MINPIDSDSVVRLVSFEVNITVSLSLESDSLPSIGPIYPNEDKDNYIMAMRSDETNLTNTELEIEVEKVPVALAFHDGNGEDIDFSAIYPGLEIYVNVTALPTRVAAPPAAVEIYIQWDPDLNMGGNITTIQITFADDGTIDTCSMITGNGNTTEELSCDEPNEPLMIPYDMIYKPIGEENTYLFDVYSNHVNLTETYPTDISRKVQTVNINMPDNIVVGAEIPINITINDTQIYQPYTNTTI